MLVHPISRVGIEIYLLEGFCSLRWSGSSNVSGASFVMESYCNRADSRLLGLKVLSCSQPSPRASPIPS